MSSQDNLNAEREAFEQEKKLFYAERDMSGIETCLFVANLDFNTDAESFREIFAPFGSIKRVHLLTDATGKSKRSGFITFYYKVQADKAIESLDGKHTHGNSKYPLVVKIREKLEHKSHPRYNNTNTNPGNTLPPPITNSLPPPYSQPNVVYIAQPVANPPRTHFPPPVVIPQSHPTHLPPRETSSNYNQQGQTYNNYSNQYETPFNPSEQLFSKPYSTFSQDQHHDRKRPSSYTEYPPPKKAYSQRPSDNPPSNVLYVSNLNNLIVEQHLIDTFSHYGTVINCKLTKPGNYAFITYQHIESAMAAVNSLNNDTTVNLNVPGSPLIVSYKRPKV